MEITSGKPLASAVRGELSSCKLFRQWYVACLSEELGSGEPLARTIMGVPIVLFREDGGSPVALLDRCPHRNVPLSAGRVVDGELACIYHGWQFDAHGERSALPGLENQEMPGCKVDRFYSVEQDGFVWLCPLADTRPETAVPRLPMFGDSYHTFSYVFDLECTLHAALENALDVAHTSFLHGGLFRGVQERNPVQVDIGPIEGGFEAEYIGEPLLPGGRKPPPGVKPQHWDRYRLPGTVEVEYRAGDSTHILNTIYHTPVDAVTTRMYFTGHMQLTGVGRFFKPLIAYNIKKILKQDINILAEQTRTILRFDGEDYQSSPMDLFGPQIVRFMRHAKKFEMGEVDTPVPEMKPRSVRITL